MKFHTSHEFHVSPEKYMEIYLEKEFEKFIVANSSLKKRDVISEKKEGDIIIREIEICSGIEIPSVLKKVIGIGEPCYIEKTHIDVKNYTTNWTINPNYFQNKFKAFGDTKVVQTSKNLCERHISGTISVSLPFIGKIAENFIIESIKKTYAETARSFEIYLREKKGKQ